MSGFTGLDQLVVAVLDVDRGDVVGQEDDLVRVKLLGVLARQVLRLDVSRLQEPRHERARPREGVDHVDVPVRQRLAELLFEDVLDGVDDEVHALDGRIDDAELFGHPGERRAEELVVEFVDDALPALGVVDALGAFGDGPVELVQRGAFLLRDFLVQEIDGLLHRHRDDV